MTAQTIEHSEFRAHTATSAANQLSKELQPVAQTQHAPSVIVVEIANWQNARFGLQPKVVGLDSLVSKYEADPKRKAALEKARTKLAATLGADGKTSLRGVRLAKGMSQAELALKIGTTQAQIARIESGRQDVQIGTIERLATALNLDLMDAIKAFVDQRTMTAT